MTKKVLTTMLTSGAFTPDGTLYEVTADSAVTLLAVQNFLAGYDPPNSRWDIKSVEGLGTVHAVIDTNLSVDIQLALFEKFFGDRPAALNQLSESLKPFVY